MLAGWKPEPWSAADLLNRTDAFTASGDALDEVFRVAPDRDGRCWHARALLLAGAIVPLDPAAGVDPASVPALVAEMIRRVGTPPFFLGLDGAGHGRDGPAEAGHYRCTADSRHRVR